MRVWTFAFFILLAAVVCNAQTTTLNGSIFDPHGALVPGAKVEARYEKGGIVSVHSDDEGRFTLSLRPGIYALEVSRPGFVKVEIAEYILVDAGAKVMLLDFVLFGANDHEPCGYGGADCLHRKGKEVVRGIRSSSSPELKKVVMP